jgi:RNA recognition motif-containing protein
MAPITLFVGNLPYSTTERDLREVFERAGVTTTAVRVVTDMDSGRSRGHAFVEVAGGEAAERAKAQLNGFNLDGRTLVVDDARERRAPARRQPARSRDSGGRDGSAAGRRSRP